MSKPTVKCYTSSFFHNWKIRIIPLYTGSGFDGHGILMKNRDVQERAVYLNEYIQNRKDGGIDA